MRGDIVKVDTKTGAKETVFKLKTAMDNLAFDSQDRMYLTVMSESAIYEIDLEAETARKVRCRSRNISHLLITHPLTFTTYVSGGTPLWE